MLFYPIPLQVIDDLVDKTKEKEKLCNHSLLPYVLPLEKDERVWLIPELPPHERLNLEADKLQSYNEILQLLSKITNLPSPQNILEITQQNLKPYFPEHSYAAFLINGDIKTYLEGRRLLGDELPISTLEIHEHVSYGFIRYELGMRKQRSSYECKRCGNTKVHLFGTFDCYRCKGKCVYCRSCIMMGRVTACSPLLTWKSEIIPQEMTKFPFGKKGELAWDGTLSYFQQKASNKLCNAIDQFIEGTNTHSFFLVWAVCGSGKTEMLFRGIELGLQHGLRVLIATPRTDVVLELEPRFKQAFPKTKIHAFYGGAEDRFAQGELIISTTHQLLRFYKSFDLVIIDEVDAFPYTADKKLRYAVSEARRDRGFTVFVSATPDEKMKRDTKTGQILCAKVARRYHRHPLPVPKLRWVGQWKKLIEKNRLPRELLKWIDGHMREKRQVFLFVPTVQVMQEVEKVLQKEITPVKVAAVHSADNERREKVMAFRKGDIRLLVTTTILERGVTVKGVQVGVLGAEDRIFTESALVQIAGRVGRSPEEPTGDVIFFHFGKTEEMIKAVKHIKNMNVLGEKELNEEKEGLEDVWHHEKEGE
ncbi:DEAD/DEAH box helicase [Evansella sp. AB-P1]|uniref:DEAD/DEAH box helicase n=1 Tax=Evansella sp. AB-P1 TaxID=3037653 RepID=UPI00241EC7FC|nr:DEAD/DEAH box helicase [Evansella sp. AB-P1]MDG5786681.1 DEAD/DEAH box helicase [Evansella sp. AB-P1]